MATLRVLRPGALATVQDLGRPGLGRLGVSPSGAMDPLALRVANRLLGNAEAAPALELSGPGAELEVLEETRLALGGGDLRAALDGVALEPWRSVRARAGQRLRFGGRRRGARVMLALPGGIAAPAVLGSASTDVDAGLGGRPLAPGDELTARGGVDAGERVAGPRLASAYARPFTLRIVLSEDPGVAGALAALLAGRFTVSARSSRVGYRFEGPRLPDAGGGARVSAPLAPGTVQLPPGGQPILLMADRPTVGGYPVLGWLAAADRPRAAQLWPGHAVRFEACTAAQAVHTLAELETLLERAVPR